MTNTVPSMEELVRASLTADDRRKKAAVDILLSETNPMDLEPYFQLSGLAALLDVSTRTLTRLGVHNECAHRLGIGVKRYKLSEVVAYLETTGRKVQAA